MHFAKLALISLAAVVMAAPADAASEDVERGPGYGRGGRGYGRGRGWEHRGGWGYGGPWGPPPPPYYP